MEAQRLMDAMVDAMLLHAAFDGWSKSSMAAAARDLDLDPTLSARLFPRGPIDAVAHFVEKADRAMAASLAEAGFDSDKVGERVFQAVRLRLQPWGEHRESIRRATSLLSLPSNLPLAARLTWNTADAIWRVVGDQSHDFAWYTKRATLSAVYSATLLYWLEDSSEDAEETWAFLRRRLADIRNIPKIRERVEGWVTGLKPPARRWGMPGR
ncbi:COQ9 family protein [Paramagnetospirillum kuznetsovii]|uniref:COQ9 family protein n=1 Tax=Paramagnetospirillum kuznetsovii TaxID=2053833 RepID=A0A364NU13_9PROT|nr:COQ9 family protein [Paramagnetospirillum kuznetsovii]RAU20573.1 COQ9 family protein [Paramagnetospirillum kuznetsovii]